MKAAITYPTESYLQKMSLFFNYRIKASKNFLKEILFTDSSSSSSTNAILDTSAGQTKKQENISVMIKAIGESGLLALNTGVDRGIVNAFVGQKATNTRANA